MVCVGAPQEHIARVLLIGHSTLQRHYADEMELGLSRANGSVAGKLFREAMGGNVTAMIFWLKTRARWRENDPAPQAKDGAQVDPRADAKIAAGVVDIFKSREVGGSAAAPS
jgi:hypothetical protein